MTIIEKVKIIQQLVNVSQDGIWGRATSVAVAHKLRIDVTWYTTTTALNRKIQSVVGAVSDGVIGHGSADSIMEYLGQPIAITDDGAFLKAESVYHTDIRQSPNISKSSITPRGIILHHSSGSYGGSVSWCLNKASKVSYHCIIDLQGSRTQLAKDVHRAWHAGTSSFNGVSDCNGFMLGLAFSGDTNKRELTADEITSAALWLRSKIRKWNMPKNLSTITTHRHVSPGRKDDVDVRAEQAVLKALRKIINI